jgi:uncharacterized membrane protein (UPF0127 family)
MMIQETLKVFNHDALSKRRWMFAFLPWAVFWRHGGSQLADYSQIQVGIGPRSAQCNTITKIFQVVLAKTDASRAKGLSGRATPLESDRGMLFVFDPPQEVSFWMKNTLIPLDIAFFNPEGLLLSIQHMAVEADPSNPQKFFSPHAMTSTVLEVAPGAFAADQAAISRGLVLCANTLK